MKFTIILNEKQAKRLDELAHTLQKTKADALREAIDFLTRIVRETADGKRAVHIVPRGGDEPVRDITPLH